MTMINTISSIDSNNFNKTINLRKGFKDSLRLLPRGRRNDDTRPIRGECR